MKAYIAENISGGQVLLKSPFSKLPIKIARGSEHMFESETEYRLFLSNITQMTNAGKIKIKTIAEKKNVYMSSAPVSPASAPKSDEVDENVVVVDNKNIEKIEALKAEVKLLQDEYKADGCEEERQTEIKARISDIKKEIKALK
jgi:hypothetical protein